MVNENISSNKLKHIENYLDKIWQNVGIDIKFTRHFMDRVNDKRNIKDIEPDEIVKIFRDTYKKYGKIIPKLGNKAEAVLTQMKTDVNVPFVLKWDGKEFDMVAKTVMRKKGFKTRTKRFTVENIKLPIKIGDTVLMGKFKNKKVVVKTIGWSEKGDLLINGKSAMRMRIPKKPNIFDETIEEFLTTIDMNDILNEASINSSVGSDDGPSHGFGNFRSYRKRGDVMAKKLGFMVMNYILKPKTKEDKSYRKYPDGPIDSVSYFPAGIGTGKTPNNQDNLTGAKAYNKWKKHITGVAKILGYELVKFMDPKDIKLIKKDSIQTIKKQKEDELKKK
jgi:hypothetical protein